MVNDELLEDYLLLVVKTLQSNYESTKLATNAITDLLEKTDELSLNIIGKRIVKRGNDTLVDAIVGGNPNRKIKPKN